MRCGANDIAAKIDQRDINAVMPKIIAVAETLTNQAREAAAPPKVERERPMRGH